MKLLVDTSVWSLALRRKKRASLGPDEQNFKAELVQAIHDGRIAMLGILRQELLSGIKEAAIFEKTRARARFLSRRADPHRRLTRSAARIYNECRSQGVQAGTVDILDLCRRRAKRLESSIQ